MPKDKETDPIPDLEPIGGADDDEEPEETESTKGGGLYNISGLKILIMLLVTYILIQSDMFSDKFLSLFKDSTVNLVPTNKGVIIQGLVLTLALVAIYTAVEYGVV